MSREVALRAEIRKQSKQVFNADWFRNGQNCRYFVVFVAFLHCRLIVGRDDVALLDRCSASSRILGRLRRNVDALRYPRLAEVLGDKDVGDVGCSAGIFRIMRSMCAFRNDHRIAGFSPHCGQLLPFEWLVRQVGSRPESIVGMQPLRKTTDGGHAKTPGPSVWRNPGAGSSRILALTPVVRSRS